MFLEAFPRPRKRSGEKESFGISLLDLRLENFVELVEAIFLSARAGRIQDFWTECSCLIH
jgi:hypothetical protein